MVWLTAGGQRYLTERMSDQEHADSHASWSAFAQQRQPAQPGQPGQQGQPEQPEQSEQPEQQGQSVQGEHSPENRVLRVARRSMPHNYGRDISATESDDKGEDADGEHAEGEDVDGDQTDDDDDGGLYYDGGEGEGEAPIGGMAEALCRGPIETIKVLLGSEHLVYHLSTLDAAMIAAAARGDAESVVFLHGKGASSFMPSYFAAKARGHQDVVDVMFGLKIHPGSPIFLGFEDVPEDVAGEDDADLVTEQLDVIAECHAHWGLKLFPDYIPAALAACNKHNRLELGALIEQWK